MDKQPDILDQRSIPAEVQEIGVDYIFRCGYVKCNQTIKRYFLYCPYCGTKIDWSDADAKRLRNNYKRRNRRNV